MAACVPQSGFHLRRLGKLAALAAALATIAFAWPSLAAEPVAQSGEPIRVTLDQAKLLKLPDRTATLVIGNPLIADATVQPGGIMVVTGKGYGVTNLVALDRAGVVLLDHPIEVQGPASHVVVVYRGVERESYSCMPNCDRRITLGDSNTYFTQTLGQTSTVNAAAMGNLTKQ